MVVRSPIFRFTLFILVVLMPVALFAGPAAKRSDSGTFVDWQVSVPNYERVTLTISTPSGEVISREFKAGQAVAFHLKELPSIDDGAYVYQLTVAPKVPERVARQLKAARAANDESAAREILRGAGLGEPAIESGAFRVAGGMIVAGGADESPRPDRLAPNTASRPGTLQPMDQVIPDDLIVQGSTCVGLDCVNNESFGFDTIRLKENNTRIKFEDTSTGTCPTNDWQLTANDACPGSSNFKIEDITGSKVPFTITAGASTNSIFVDSTGRVGFRTSTPVLDLHVTTSNTPAIRLEQTNAGGFTAQTWDIAGNEANFFVRDVTSGSRLPFRIRPGAPTSSLDISADGDIGIGDASPDYRLTVVTTGAADDTVAQLENNGPTRIRFKNTSSGETWNLGHQSPSGTGLVLSDTGDGVSEMLLDVSGNMTIAGTLTQNSSRDVKTGFDVIDPATALASVRNMPIMSWVYKQDHTASRHAGPIAEDFYAAFKLGLDDKHIAPSDQSGVALAAIQGLADVVQQKDDQIRVLEQRIKQLETLVGKITENN